MSYGEVPRARQAELIGTVGKKEGADPLASVRDYRRGDLLD